MTRNAPLGDPRDHYRKVTAMADACGADLPRAFETGRVDSAEWAGMVEACRTCSQPGACGKFLALHDLLAEALPEPVRGTPPDYCVNRDRMIDLAGE